MAAIAPQKVAAQGVAPSFVAVGGAGDNFQCGDGAFIYIKNANASACVVTIASYPDTSPWGSAVPDLTVSVPGSGGERIIGPLYGAQFGNPADGRAYATYSVTASVTVAHLTV